MIGKTKARVGTAFKSARKGKGLSGLARNARITAAEFRDLQTKPCRNKFGAVKVRHEGQTYDSKSEFSRYCALKVLELAGEIRNLELHPRLNLSVEGVHICDLVPDFGYFEGNQRVMEDFKSKPTTTPSFRIKWALAKALFPGIEFRIHGVRS